MTSTDVASAPWVIHHLTRPFTSVARVARPVGRAERLSTPAALEAMGKEWNRLRSVKRKSGVGVWGETRVEEKSAVVERARKSGETIRVARIFDICVAKGAELHEGRQERKFKGRAVHQGNQVYD